LVLEKKHLDFASPSLDLAEIEPVEKNLEPAQKMKPEFFVWSKRLVNAAVTWSLLATALRFGGVVLVLPVMITHLPTEELGLWYLFVAIGGFGGLLDASIGSVSIRAVAYLKGGAQSLLTEGIDSFSETVPPHINHKLFSDLCATLRLYYIFVGLGVLVVAGFGGGWWIWQKTIQVAHPLSLRLAWFCYIAGVAYASYASLWWILLHGLNAVRQAQQAFIIALAGNYTLILLGLKLGWGLWALVAGSLAQGLLTRWLQRFYFLREAADLTPDLQHGKAQWSLLGRLWPQAWRAATISLGTYLTLTSGTLICSWIQGLDQVASYGLSYQLCSALVQIASMPMYVKFPLINQWRTKGDLATIRATVRQRGLFFWVLVVLGGAVIVGGGNWMLLHFTHSSTLLLSTWPLTLLLLFVALEGQQGLLRELVLTSNYNPFVQMVLSTGLAVFVASLLMASVYGINGLILTQLLLPLCWTNWRVPQIAWASLKPSWSSAPNSSLPS
jgi:hypothetical protein